MSLGFNADLPQQQQHQQQHQQPSSGAGAAESVLPADGQTQS